MKRNLLTKFACLALVVLATLSFAGCGEMQNYITTEGATLSDVKFENSSDFQIKKVDEKTFKATGSASKFSQEQASAFGGSVTTDNYYVVVTVKAEEGQTVKEKFFKAEDVTDGNYDMTKAKTDTADETGSHWILNLNSTSEKWLCVFEVEPTTEGEPTIYTIDFSGVKDSLKKQA